MEEETEKTSWWTRFISKLRPLTAQELKTDPQDKDVVQYLYNNMYEVWHMSNEDPAIVAERRKAESKMDALDKALARYVYEAPFSVPTYFDNYSFIRLIESGRVQLVYYGKMRDTHHQNDRLIIQALLEDFAAKGARHLFVSCETRAPFGVIEVFVLCRVPLDAEPLASIVAAREKGTLKPGQYISWLRHADKRNGIVRPGEIQLDAFLNDVEQFPDCTFIGFICDERDDYESAMQKLVNFRGIIVGYIAEGTGDRVYKDDVAKLTAYVRAVTGGRPFGYFTTFEDHGCHGTSYYVIVVSSPSVDK